VPPATPNRPSPQPPSRTAGRNPRATALPALGNRPSQQVAAHRPPRRMPPWLWSRFGCIQSCTICALSLGQGRYRAALAAVTVYRRRLGMKGSASERMDLVHAPAAR
jgi:hypothetical protein